ncbi:unnamed protein product [Phytophthora lilii]|uniref:Unnamed protein product n=1 Tax=Phytophthora lilii TaxID=2077276 RepID=A0A9W6YIN0_9STRA|nr:unnamed protein product [Phytophthora lilii]
MVVHNHEFLIGATSTKDANKEERILNPSGFSKLKPPRPPGLLKITSKWQLKGKSADEAFTLLNLHKAGDDLITLPQFRMWVKHAEDVIQVQPTMAIVSKLTNIYGDEGLAKMLEATRKIPSSNSVATKLQTEHMWIWLQDRKSPTDIFKLLNLHNGVNNLLVSLASPNANIWLRYIKFFNKYMATSGKQTTMMKSLLVIYGDEALSKMLEAATKVPHTNEFATNLQAAMFKQWLVDGKKPARIWKMLNMEKATWTTNPDAQIWRGYLAYYKAHKPAQT